MPRNDFYNQADITFIGDGTLDRDFMDGDSIRWIPGGDASGLTVGFDGAALNMSTRRDGTVELDFKQTSQSIRKYEILQELQAQGRGRAFLCMYTTATGASYLLEGCAVASTGQIGSGSMPGSGQTITLNVSKRIPVNG